LNFHFLNFSFDEIFTLKKWSIDQLSSWGPQKQSTGVICIQTGEISFYFSIVDQSTASWEAAVVENIFHQKGNIFFSSVTNSVAASAHWRSAGVWRLLAPNPKMNERPPTGCWNQIDRKPWT
jgi:hypothetical protein